MIQVDNLAETAEDLRQCGVDAYHEILYGTRGGRECLVIGGDFFPLWELLLPENQESLVRLDFPAIKARRGLDWSVDPPRYQL